MDEPQSTVSSQQELETVTIRTGIAPITYCRIGGDWWRHDTPTIMSGLVVRFTWGKCWERAGSGRLRRRSSETLGCSSKHRRRNDEHQVFAT